jgi:antitoxin PrlF
MPTATLTSKGQVTIPLSIRTVLGLHAGSKLDFIQDGSGFKVITVARDVPTRLKGRFAGRVSKPVSVAEMNEAIALEAAAQYRSAGKRKP